MENVNAGIGVSRLHPNLVRQAPNKTNLGLFKISFSTFGLTEPKCTETDLKKSQICPIQGYLTLFGTNLDTSGCFRLTGWQQYAGHNNVTLAGYARPQYTPATWLAAGQAGITQMSLLCLLSYLVQQEIQNQDYRNGQFVLFVSTIKTVQSV